MITVYRYFITQNFREINVTNSTDAKRRYTLILRNWRQHLRVKDTGNNGNNRMRHALADFHASLFAEHYSGLKTMI